MKSITTLSAILALLLCGCGSRPYWTSSFPWRESKENQEESNRILSESIPYHGSVWMSPRKRIYDSSDNPRRVLYDLGVTGYNRANEKIADDSFLIEGHSLDVVFRDGTATELTIRLEDGLDKKTWTIVYDISKDVKHMKIRKIEGDFKEKP